MSRLDRIVWRLLGAAMVYFAAQCVVAGVWPLAAAFTALASVAFARSRRNTDAKPASALSEVPDR